MSFEIAAKRYLGYRSIKNKLIGPEVVSIGRWAFMGCTALSEIWIPKGCIVSENVFDGCTSLDRVVIYEAEHPDVPLNISPELLSCLIKAKPAQSGEWIKLAPDNERFINELDERLPFYLSEDDHNGYAPFLAGGEEDYRNEDDARRDYGLSIRLNKLKMIFERFLAEDLGYSLPEEERGILDKYLKEDHIREAFGLLISETSRMTAYRRYFFDNALGAKLTKNEMLAMAGDDVQLKAMVLSDCAKITTVCRKNGLESLTLV